jgi:hypothetical protein
LIGKKVKEQVEIVLPMGKRKLKVLELETVHDIAEGKARHKRK